MKNTKLHVDPLELEAMRLVHRYSETFGRLRLAEVLAGRRTAAVREHGLDQDPAFGAAPDARHALAILDSLVRRGLLRVGGPNPRRPLLALSPGARTPLVMRDNPPAPPLERLEPIHLAQLRRLTRWRDLIALHEGLAPARLASSRALRVLLRNPPGTVDELEARALIATDAPTRFRNAVLAVLHGRLSDPTPAEMVQTLAALSPTPTIPVTRHILAWARTPRGGYTRAQLTLLGIPWPRPRGWREIALTRSLSPTELRRLLEPGAA